ncbi:MAG: hypothetical protein K2P58_08515 [Hyphomonadaceae bacterium]|nr:hypothetical protein [Hyphomonadaceae bacterium]
MAIHMICCGLPILALAAVALSGAAASVVQFADAAGAIHGLAHAYELWILLASAILVAIGAVFEVLARRERAASKFPWLFAISVGCFFVNAAIVLSHQSVTLTSLA